jgi:hypothetical protein
MLTFPPSTVPLPHPVPCARRLRCRRLRRYVFLLQDPTHQIDLDKFVINTEAHPFPIPAENQKVPPA